VIKSPAEQALMQQAAQISAEAHIRVMRASKPGLMEYELEAEFIYEVMRKGCRALAYPSIVGGGVNGCTLHYNQNDQVLRDGDLVLVDAGGEYQYYASDITRTFPVNGRFSEDQKAIYNIVLESQLAGIECVRPGIPWDTMQKKVVETLVPGLVALGILEGDPTTLIEQKAYRSVYMHSSGHWLGLDVHDVGEYLVNNASRLLEPGMVLTIEPGIYIAPNTPNIDKRWWGIGVRIEDDVLVTDTGHEVLSGAAPKTVEAIERVMVKQTVK
jgi:Xaa-Pro aminopeptidase